MLVKFYLKLGETLYRENELELAQDQVKLAKYVSVDLTKKIIDQKGFSSWAKA